MQNALRVKPCRSGRASAPISAENCPKIDEIKEHFGVSMTYVQGKENPADVASRGTTPEGLASDSNWLPSLVVFETNF